MKTPIYSLFSSVYIVFLTSLGAAADGTHKDFLQCLVAPHYVGVTTSQVVYTPKNTSYTSILDFSIQNLRFASPTTPKPLAIVTPTEESHIQIALLCARDHGVQVRIRGGGHDFEGLSYTSKVPFAVIDLDNFRNITVDAQNGTAWVQGGATLGELYYKIAEKSSTLGFPGGACSSIGIGGFLGGGGYGTLKRKYGLGADNVLDARFMDSYANIYTGLDPYSDVFWGIRGGVASSFGIVLEWKIRLVPVPKIVTVFAVHRTLEQNATKLVHRWQYVAPKIDRNLDIRVRIISVNLTADGIKKTILVSFESLFLGRANTLLGVMQKSFPELGLKKKDCKEMSWAKSTVWFAGYGGFPNGESLEVLLNRSAPPKSSFKGKSDYVQEPISEEGLEGIWKRFFQLEAGAANMMMTPYGGKMDEISESAIPFPHRGGNLYMMYSGVPRLQNIPVETISKRLKWLRSLYKYLTPYVSKNPRASYVNYNDLDLGLGSKTYEAASIWGTKYFKHNFKRLVRVKEGIDPENFFTHEQSIPSYRSIRS